MLNINVSRKIIFLTVKHFLYLQRFTRLKIVPKTANAALNCAAGVVKTKKRWKH